MSNPTTSRPWMPPGYRRRIGVIGLACSHDYGLRPASPAQLDPERPHGREAVELIIL